MNWGQLKISAAAYIHRGDIDYDQAQPFACDRMTQVLDVMENESVTAGSMSSTANELGLFSMALPPDYGRMKTVKLGGGEATSTTLLNLVEDQGQLKYAVSGGQLFALVTGTVAYAYGRQIAAIATDSDTNLILTRYPRVYLYAVIIEALVQVQDFDAVTGYQSAFDAAVEDANSLQAFSRFDSGASVQTGFRRV